MKAQIKSWPINEPENVTYIDVELRHDADGQMWFIKDCTSSDLVITDIKVSLK